MRRKDLSDNIYGCLQVIDIDEKGTQEEKKKRLHWNCKCLKCGKIVSIHGENLVSGNTTGHGCDKSEKISAKMKRVNQFIVDEDTNIIKLIARNTGNMFLINKEDYDLVKDYCWYEDKSKYLITRLPDNRRILLHRLIFFRNVENTFNNEKIDHDSRNKYDCRKQNLRKCNFSQNAQNQSIPKNNTSGIMGVNYSPNDKKWRAYVSVNRKYISLGYYTDKTQAIIARLNGEKLYYKDFAPQKHLFEKYGIN